MKSIVLIKKFEGLAEMTFGLVNASFTLPEWQAVKMTFFAPWFFVFFRITIIMHNFLLFISLLLNLWNLPENVTPIICQHHDNIKAEFTGGPMVLRCFISYQCLDTCELCNLAWNDRAGKQQNDRVGNSSTSKSLLQGCFVSRGKCKSCFWMVGWKEGNFVSWLKL